MNEQAHVVIYAHDAEGSTVEWRCPCEKSSWQDPCGCVFPDPSPVAALAVADQLARRERAGA